jgi:hypothetical protein
LILRRRVVLNQQNHDILIQWWLINRGREILIFRAWLRGSATFWFWGRITFRLCSGEDPHHFNLSEPLDLVEELDSFDGKSSSSMTGSRSTSLHL